MREERACSAARFSTRPDAARFAVISGVWGVHLSGVIVAMAAFAEGARDWEHVGVSAVA